MFSSRFISWVCPDLLHCPSGLPRSILASMAPAQANQSILAGFQVLQEVITAAQPLGSREVARRMGLEHSRVNRILGTLATAGMLQQNSDTKYYPGPGLHALSALSLHASGLIPAALPVLEPFHAEGATVALGTLWKDTIVYLLHANPSQDLPSSAGAHENYPKEKSVLTRVLEPGCPEFVQMEREDTGEMTFAVRVGSRGTLAVGIVYPLGHPGLTNIDGLAQKVLQAGRKIARAIGSE